MNRESLSKILSQARDVATEWTRRNEDKPEPNKLYQETFGSGPLVFKNKIK